MKINIEIECTPQEARVFMGLPDIKPMQDAMMAGMQERMEDQLKRMDPEALMKEWFSPGIEGFQQMQKAFWSAATGEAPGAKDKK
ncbi:MAG: DUF6489 family protein [Hyphomicrobiales bacterium]